MRHANPGVEPRFQFQTETPLQRQNFLSLQRIHQLEVNLAIQDAEVSRLDEQLTEYSRLIGYQHLQLEYQAQRLANLEESLAILKAEVSLQGSDQTSRSPCPASRELVGSG